MRLLLLISCALVISLAALTGCNSKDAVSQSQKPVTPAQSPSNSPPADNARRITADELYKLFEKNEVLIIDTRGEDAYREEHIKGAISVPSNEMSERLEELPRTKMIVAYCT